MTRIDHAALAKAAIESEPEYQFNKIDQAAEAITHALLALVEQQKIANVIALSKITGQNLWGDPDTVAALGIENKSEPCCITGPNLPVGDVDWECRTHPEAQVFNDGTNWVCPVGGGTREYKEQR